MVRFVTKEVRDLAPLFRSSNVIHLKGFGSVIDVAHKPPAELLNDLRKADILVFDGDDLYIRSILVVL